MKNKAVVKMPDRRNAKNRNRPARQRYSGHARQETRLPGRACAKTPERYDLLCASSPAAIKINLEEIVSSALFHVQCDEMVILRDIELWQHL